MKITFKEKEKTVYTYGHTFPGSVFSFKNIDAYGVNQSLIFLKTSTGFVNLANGQSYGENEQEGVFKSPCREDFCDVEDYLEDLDCFTFVLKHLSDEQVHIYDSELIIKEKF